MATPGRPLDQESRRRIERALREGATQSEAARRAGVSRTTIWKRYKRLSSVAKQFGKSQSEHEAG